MSRQHHHDSFHDDGPPISQLQTAVKSLNAFVKAVLPPPRDDATPPSSPPSAPARRSPVQLFSRQQLVAGQWKELARSHIAVCGLNGVGTLAADALVRAGVGRVLLVDSERIHWSSMGQMGFCPGEVGFSRIQALRLRLQSMRSRTSSPANDSTTDIGVVDSFAVDWSSATDLEELQKKLKVSAVRVPPPLKIKPPAKRDNDHHNIEAGDDDATGPTSDDTNASADENQKQDTCTPPATPASGLRHGLGLGLFEALTQRRPHDAVLSCLEDDHERLALNQICLELSLPLLQVSLSPCNSRIVIRTVLPGNSCCLECTEPSSTCMATSTRPNAVDDVAKSIAKAFPASLPHVELMAGGLLAQHAIKFLVEIGDFVPCFTVNALTFEIESFAFPPNRLCANATCRKRQEDEQSHATMRH